jgi:hypothetical protein
MSEHKTIKININASDKEIEEAIEKAVAYELENGYMSALNVEFVHEEEEKVAKKANLTSADGSTAAIAAEEFNEFMDMVKDVQFTGDIDKDLDTVEKLYKSKKDETNCTNCSCDQNCRVNYEYTEGTKLTGCTFKMVRKAVKKGAIAMRGDKTAILFLTQEDMEADDWIIIW